MAARTNGDIRFGSFMTFMGGTFVAYGVTELSDNVWYGVILMVLGVVSDVAGIARVEAGIKELVRVHDLEKKNSRV